MDGKYKRILQRNIITEIMKTFLLRPVIHYLQELQIKIYTATSTRIYVGDISET